LAVMAVEDGGFEGFGGGLPGREGGVEVWHSCDLYID
jgi:hypothetical protein